MTKKIEISASSWVYYKDTLAPILADILHKLPTWANTDHNSNS